MTVEHNKCNMEAKSPRGQRGVICFAHIKTQATSLASWNGMPTFDLKEQLLHVLSPNRCIAISNKT